MRGNWVVAIFLSLCFIIILAFLLVSRASSAAAHDIYTMTRNFDGVLCCNGEDCKRAYKGIDFTLVNGGYELRSTKEFIPPGTTGISPDAFFHICRRDDIQKTVRCLLVPDSGT